MHRDILEASPSVQRLLGQKYMSEGRPASDQSHVPRCNFLFSNKANALMNIANLMENLDRTLQYCSSTFSTQSHHAHIVVTFELGKSRWRRRRVRASAYPTTSKPSPVRYELLLLLACLYMWPSLSMHSKIAQGNLSTTFNRV